jgi:flagellar hook-associated protein 2
MTAMSTFSISGLYSGFDTGALIQQLLALERIPITRLENKKTLLTNKTSAFSAFGAKLLALKTQAQYLSKPDTFRVLTASSSDSEIATASATTDAVPGSFDVVVTALAEHHKISSATYADPDESLNLAGEFVINGEGVYIESADSLANLVTKINAAQAGVTASILHISDNEHKLVLSSEESGAAGEINISDANSTDLLQSLGILNSTETLRNAISGGAASNAFDDAVTGIGVLYDLTDPQSGIVRIKGIDVAIDFASDSLSEIKEKINSAGIPGVTATIETVEIDGRNLMRLEIQGVSDAADFTDENNILSTLGILKHGYTGELTQARDAAFSIDNIDFTRGSNTIADAVEGVTFTLISEGSATITLARDTSSIVGTVQAFVTQYNNAIEYIKEQSSYDPDTETSGILLGEYSLQWVEGDIASLVNSYVPGLYRSDDDVGRVLNTLSAVGIAMNSDGTLALDSSELESALADDPVGVEKLFAYAATTTSSYVSFVSKTDATGATYSSSDPRYSEPLAIVISQAAEQAAVAAGTAQTQASSGLEQLTFSGSLFGDEPIDVYLAAGNTLADTVAQINNDSRLSGKITASIDTGKLKLTSIQYGSDISFGVVSDKEAASDNSGVGTTEISDTGRDVEGTIGGYAAVGDGRVLKGVGTAFLTSTLEQTDPSTEDETLTFSGALFSQDVQIVLSAGNTLADTIDQINADSNLNSRVIASERNGKLVLTSKVSGQEGSFTVVSDKEAAGDNCGIGTTPLDAWGTETPIDGLCLLITATSAGGYGTVSLSKGIGDLLNDLIAEITDSVDGVLTNETKSLSDQMGSIDDEIASLEEQLTMKEERLTQQFAAMESMLATLQAQSSYLTMQLASLLGTSSQSNNSTGGGYLG